MARLGTINEYVKEKEKQQAANAVSSPSPQSTQAKVDNPTPGSDPTVSPAVGPIGTSVTSPSSLIGNSSDNAIEYDNAQQLHDAVVPQVRSDQIQGMSESEAIKQGNISPKEYWSEQYKKDPTNSYALLAQQLSSDETPDEKAKREKSERLGQVFSNLGNVIGTAANLYYTTKGAPYMNFNSNQQAENARIQQIRDKRDALQRQRDSMLFNSRLGDIQYDRSLQAARDKYAAAQSEKDADRLLRMSEGEKNRQSRQSIATEQNRLRAAQIANTAAHNKVMESISGQNAATNKQRADAYVKQANDKSKADKNNDYLPVDDNLIPIPKSQSKGLYSQLYQIMKRDPQIQGSGVENVQLQFGEGGDQDTKMMNIVRRRLNDSPAAKEYLQKYLGNDTKKQNNQNNSLGLGWGNQNNNSLGLNW